MTTAPGKTFDERLTRLLVVAQKLERIRTLRNLLAALDGNPTINLRDLIEGALQFEQMGHAAEAERRARQ